MAAATASVAAVLAMGQGTALAAPSDSADTSGTSATGDGTNPAGVESTQTADSGKVAEPEATRQPAPATDPTGTTGTDDANADDNTGSTTGEPTATTDADAGGEASDSSGTAADPTSSAAVDPLVTAPGDRPASAAKSRAGTDDPSDHAAPSTQTNTVARSTDPAADVADPSTDTHAARVVTTAAVSTDTVAVRAEATETTPARATATTVTAVSAATAAPRVTVKGIVTDLLTWIGLGPLAKDLPVPDAPVSAMIQSLWLGVRELQHVFNNQRPSADPTTSGQRLDGVVTGSLNASDYDDATLTYTVVSGPGHGKVVVDALGNFTYTPDAATAAGGGTDRFTITVDDHQVHGLLGLFDLLGPVTKTITLSVKPTGVAATQGSGPAALNLSDLQGRQDLSIGTSSSGAVNVIDGTFTNALVFGAADAAAVLNAAAGMLGASMDFASPDAIITQTAGSGQGGGTVETFYRLNESVAGLSVLGGDVILVVGENGAVTGLFSHYVTLPAGVDLTADAAVDDESEARLFASAAYLLDATAATPDQAALAGFVAASTFQDDLVVYALDSQVAPALAWRVKVIVTKPAAGEGDSGVDSGATVYLYANGSKAGQVIVQVSNLEGAAVTGVVADSLGRQRTITYRTTTVWFIFTSYSLVDDVRNITAYKTDYSWFGFGGPALPGSVVQRGSGGWDTAAVSAFANAEAVFDYYQTVLGLKSFDGKGAAVKVSIGYNPTSLFAAAYNNAYWDPTIKQFVFGNGANLGAAEDVVGHEYTHAVVSSVLGASALGSGESGALNEAFADILGSLIEGKTGSAKWLIGEDSTFPGGAVRNLADPASIVTSYGAYRTNYANRYTGSGDDGGEHINSTIFSYAAYKMITDPATSAITTAQWAELFYRAIYRLSTSAKFVDGRAAVLSAAGAMNFTGAQQAAIAAAFDAVGIKAVPPPTIAV
ncbi:MAG: M4 family metallopeptidase [Mycobacterium sp.]